MPPKLLIGSADIIKNVIGAAGEIIGAGDAVQGIGAGIDIATMHGLDLLSTENKIKAVKQFGWFVAIPEQCHRNCP